MNIPLHVAGLYSHMDYYIASGSRATAYGLAQRCGDRMEGIVFGNYARDKYCMLSGATALNSISLFSSFSKDDFHPDVTPDDLSFERDDIAALEDFCILCYKDHDGVNEYRSFPRFIRPVTEWTSANTGLGLHFRPVSFSKREYRFCSREGELLLSSIGKQNSYPILYSALLVALAAAPSLEPHVLYALAKSFDNWRDDPDGYLHDDDFDTEPQTFGSGFGVLDGDQMDVGVPEDIVQEEEKESTNDFASSSRSGRVFRRSAGDALAFYDIPPDYRTSRSAWQLIPGVNYGAISRAIEWPVSAPLRVGNFGATEFDPAERVELEAFWKSLLKGDDKSRAQVLDEAWLGQGHLYVFVRPDKFPIGSAMRQIGFKPFRKRDNVPASSFKLDSLSSDVLFEIASHLPPTSTVSLLQTNNQLRQRLLPYASSAAYEFIRFHTPHILPAPPLSPTPDWLMRPQKPWETDGPARPKTGKEEDDKWTQQWSSVGINLGKDWREQGRGIPWLRYSQACERSPSMKNRKRLWGIALQLEKKVVELGLLD